jgi:branched-subunit amino acid aminotransferase/4-amino-4-deoxychorismate lyase
VEPLRLLHLRRAGGAALVSTTREVQPVHRVEDIELDLNDPIIQNAAGRVRERIAAELAAA